MILEICLCALAAAAVLVLLWLLCAQFLLPVRTKNVYLLLLGRADGETLEQDCRAYLLLKNAGVIQRPLIIVDDGLNSDGQRLAGELTRLDSAITLCPRDSLEEILKAQER